MLLKPSTAAARASRTLKDILQHGEQDRGRHTNQTRPQQHGKGVGRADHAAQRPGWIAVLGEAGPSGLIETDERRNHHQNDRYDRVPPVGVPTVFWGEFTGVEIGQGLGTGGQNLTSPRAPLGTKHRPPVSSSRRDHECEDERKYRVEGKWYGPQKDRKGVQVRTGLLEGVSNKGDLVSDPGGDQRHARHRCCGGINQKRQFLPTDAVAIGNRSHRVADDQRIGIVVEEDGNAHQPRHHLGPTGRRGKGLQRTHDTERAAALAHHPDHPTEEHRKDDDAHVIGVDQRPPDVGVDKP